MTDKGISELKFTQEAKLAIDEAFKRAHPEGQLDNFLIGTLTGTAHLFKHPCYASVSYTYGDVSYDITCRADTQELALYNLMARLLRHVA